jgi:hypothetical protein
MMKATIDLVEGEKMKLERDLERSGKKIGEMEHIMN